MNDTNKKVVTNEPPKEADYVALGERVRKARHLRGLTQSQLSEICDIASSYVGIIERGNKKSSVETLVKISNALNVSADYLLFDSLEISEGRLSHINGDVLTVDVSPINKNTNMSELLVLLNKVMEQMNTEDKEYEISLVLKILSNITEYYGSQ
jgi:transcriptional regulator with XRE-family HTH domain